MDGKRSFEGNKTSLHSGTSKRAATYTTNPYAAVYQPVSSNGTPNRASSSPSQLRSTSVSTSSLSPATLAVTTATSQKSSRVPDQYPSTFAFPLVRSIFGYDEATIDVLTWLQDSLLRVGFHKQDLNEVEKRVWRQIQGLVMTKNFEALDYSRALWVAIGKPDESPITAGIREPVFAVVKGFLRWQPWLDGQATLARVEAYKQIVHSQTQHERLRSDQTPQIATSTLPQGSRTSIQTGKVQPILPSQHVAPAVLGLEQNRTDTRIRRDSRLLESHGIAQRVIENANEVEEPHKARQLPEEQQHLAFANVASHQWTKKPQQHLQNQIFATNRNYVLASNHPNLQQQQQHQQVPEQLPQAPVGTGFAGHSASIPEPVVHAIPETASSTSRTSTAQMSLAQAAYLQQLQPRLQHHSHPSNFMGSNVLQVNSEQLSTNFPSSQSSSQTSATQRERNKFYIYPAVKYISPSSFSRQNLQMVVRFALSPQSYAQCLRTTEYVHGKIMINLRGYLGDSDQTVSWTDMGVTINDKSFVVKHGNDRPVNLSSLVRPGYNTLRVLLKRWPDRFHDKSYTVAVEMCPIITREEVIDMVRSKHIEVDQAKEQILKTIRPQPTDANDDDSDDIQCLTSSYKLALTCPLSKKRMKLPVRSVQCQHATCFDLYNYLENSRASWKCPICLGACTPPVLAVDDFVKWMIENTEEKVQTVTIHPNEQWKPDIPPASPESADMVEDD
ncbi:uncharacterized protein V1513DRAFT_462490 [Lipomyces chichibuensis]|uniref:uncharacterized protein n=1 Tax=Lipomyces chichibuensis TaxID=1546026 RepID=UPI0033437CD4